MKGEQRYRRLSTTPKNRSLERGVSILRAFRPGIDLLGNGELAERTGLAPATVSRLTQTLTAVGLLDYNPVARAYRLAAPVLSLAHAMRSASPVLKFAAPAMRSIAEKLNANVGVAVADQHDMVYLESIRHNRRGSLRSVVAGQRVPIELTSLGRAYLSVLPEADCEALFAEFARRHADWPSLHREIDAAMVSVRQRGFCAASWQPGVIALARPLVVAHHPVYVFNISTSRSEPQAALPEVLAEQLFTLTSQAGDALRSANAV